MKLPGPPIQSAFVVRDLDAAIARWLAMGVGPFYRRSRAGFYGARYRGEACAPDYSLAMAYWGDMQVELIAQNCETPFVYREFLDDGQEGLHHLLITVPDLEAFRRTLDPAAYELLAEMKLEPSGGVFYLRDTTASWPLIEIGELAPPVFDLFDMMKREAKAWDGRDPVRSLD